jgi:NAD(P)-dependent dehydrogenase (short-subunit alcohol dehydrogenase family)
MEGFAGKSILVSGGTGGLGNAVSLGFLDQGAVLTVTYRKSDEFEALKSAAGSRASWLTGYEVDVTDEAAVGQMVDAVIKKNRSIHALVNCVGAYAGGIPLWETGPKVFDQMLALNLRAGFVLARAVVPIMLKQKSGSIVNVASQAAVNHAAGAAAYAASKAGAVAMIDSLAADLNGTGVRANSVLPSIIDTEANRRAMPNADFTKWPEPGDIARVILFLCTDEAKLIHGAAIPVYGNT